MPNPYYKPAEPRRIFRTPKTTAQYVGGAGRCNQCPSWNLYCEACRQELNHFKTLEAVQEYERGVQATLAAAEQ